MAKHRTISMLEKEFQARREKALLSLELLTEDKAGIGDHSTEDFYKNAIESISALAEAEDVLETINRHFSE